MSNLLFVPILGLGYRADLPLSEMLVYKLWSEEEQMESNLTYYIFEGVLTGFANGSLIHISALSGGGGGSTKNRPSESVNNPYMEGLKTASTRTGHVHGGPLPPGTYAVKHPAVHKHLGLSAELVPKRGNMMGRGGFFIHGRGPHGSDGCIVPLDHVQFNRLMHALNMSNGGILVVAERMGGERFA
jgi:hypothetical protein